MAPSGRHSGGQARWVDTLLRMVTNETNAESIAGDLEEERRQLFLAEDRWRSRFWLATALVEVVVRIGCLRLHELAQRALSRNSGRDQKTKARGAREAEPMHGWFADLHQATRGWRRQPKLALVAVSVLVLGLAGTTIFFGLVRSVLLRPLPFPQSERLVRIYEVPPQDGPSLESLSPPNFFDWREQTKTLSDVAAYWSPNLTLTGDGDPQKILAATISANLFRVLRTHPKLGRDLSPEDDEPGAPGVCLLSHGLWETRYGSDRSILGKHILLNARRVEVIGVMPKGFDFPTPGTALWVPLQQPRTRQATGGTPYRAFRILNTVARLEDGTTLESSAAEFDRLAREASERYPDTNADYGARVVSLRDDRVGTHRRSLIVLFGSVLSVLLVACGNLGMLMAARSVARLRELGIRQSLGATRYRLGRLLLSEVLVLTVAGGAVAIFASAWALENAELWLPDTFPRLTDVDFDLAVFGFALVSSCTAAVVASVPPFFHWFRAQVETARVGTEASVTATPKHSAHSFIVAAQIALSLVLLVGAGLFLKSFYHLAGTDTGFRRNDILFTFVELPFSRFREHHRRVSFFTELTKRTGELPGVERVGLSLGLPIDPRAEFFVTRSGYQIEGRVPAAPSDRPLAALHVVDVGAFHTLGIPLIEGRVFEDRDDLDRESVIIINKALANLYWPNENPLGNRITHDLSLIPGDRNVRRIVGVVGDSRYYSLDRAPEPQLFIPHGQTSWPQMHLLIQTTQSPELLSGSIRELVWSLDPDVPAPPLAALETIVRGAVAAPRMRAELSLSFAGIALVLAGLGLYGVVAFSVQQRRAEIGLRMALGASFRDVVWLFMFRGMRWTLIGLAIGCLCSIAFGRLLASLLFGVSPTDAGTLVTMSLLTSFVSLAAIYVPSRRAARTDPVSVLRAR